MKLVYLGEELDTKLEHELISKSKFGYNITIKYSENSWRFKSNIEKVKLSNYTEVHHLYETISDGGEDRIAFESDIHGHGCNRNIEDIESVTIEIATKINSDYYQRNI